VDGTNNSGGAIMHQVECNVYYKGHVERIRIDVYDLGKTEVILGILWLVAHNPKINWETREVKMTRCPPLCVMNIEWDYNYYQPWSDNKWLVDKMLAILDEDITM